MKKLLNTLFVMTQGAYLAKDGENVVVRIDAETKLRLPLHNLDGIVCFGNVSASPFLLGKCAGNGITITFLSAYGRFLARVVGPVSGNVLLRREQYRIADAPEQAIRLARNIVVAKIANCRTVLARALRDHPEKVETDRFRRTLDLLAAAGKDALQAESLEQLRGYEGDAAKLYFALFNQLITAQRETFSFSERTRRPPRDPMNALLSFLYVLLAHDVRSALESVGLDPQVGFFHRDRPGRPSLALDLMEELRPVLADRLALNVVNRRQVRSKGFTRREGGAVLMDDATRRLLLTAWQERKHDSLEHPFLRQKILVGLLPHTQALLLARTLRGDLVEYPPFVWR